MAWAAWMTEMGISALYLILSLGGFVGRWGDNPSCSDRRSDLVRRKRNVCFLLDSTSSINGECVIVLFLFKLLDDRFKFLPSGSFICCSGDRMWSSRVAESVRRMTADELMSSSERPTRSLKPESFCPELANSAAPVHLQELSKLISKYARKTGWIG